MSKGARIGIVVGVAALLLIGAAVLSWRTGPLTTPQANPAAREPAAALAVAPPQMRPAPAAGPDAQHPSLPTSFQLAGDFYVFSTEALKSSDSGVVFEGFQALRECEGVLRDANDLRIVADGGAARGVVHGEATEERRKAIRDLLRRCDGFSRMDYRERRATYAAFQKRGQELGAVEFIVSARTADQITREELTTLLESTSPAAWHLVLRPLVNSANATRPENPEAAERFDTSRGLGFMLAACERGSHCGPDSYQGTLSCAYYGICGKSFLEGWQKEYSETQIATVDAFRAQILDAVRTRDYSKLGL